MSINNYFLFPFIPWREENSPLGYPCRESRRSNEVIVKLELPIELTREEDGCFIAICPVFNVGSQGDSEEECLENAKAALELYLEDEDVQKQNAHKILKYVVSVGLSDEEKRFNENHPDMNQPHVTCLLGVGTHGCGETSEAIRA